MRVGKYFILPLFALSFGWVSAYQGTPRGGTLFEGARLIAGDGRAPTENSARKINKVYQKGTALDRGGLSETLSAEATN